MPAQRRLLETPPQDAVQTELGTGGTSTVFLRMWRDSGGVDHKQAYKPPIPPSEAEYPNQLLRNVAAHRIAQMLGFDVIVEAQMEDVASLDKKETAPGLHMAVAKGTCAREALQDPRIVNNPEVRREMTKLDVVDYLLDTADRSNLNFFIHCGTGGAKVTGIDNDLTFSYNEQPPLYLPVIDTDMSRAILALSPGQLSAALPEEMHGERAYLTTGAPATGVVSPLLKRLETLQAHVRHLRDSGQLIRPSDWARNLENLPSLTRFADPQSYPEDTESGSDMDSPSSSSSLSSTSTARGLKRKDMD